MLEDQSRLTIDPHSEGVRLDVFLTRNFPEHSRNQWKARIAASQVLVNGHGAHKDLLLRSGWTITVQLPPASAMAPLDLANPGLAARIKVLFQDSDLLAVDKPAGLPTHPLKSDERETLFNALLAIDPAIAQAGPKTLEGGLVHRLDTQTSGVILAARTPRCYERLQDLFASHAAEKTYLAIVCGELHADREIRWPIAHHARNSKRMVAITPELAVESPRAWRANPRPATSQVHVRQILRDHTLVEVRVRQAQMHQIRVHLLAIGHPLLADTVYRLPQTPERPESHMQRHALHAWRIDMPHPITDTPLSISADLPQDFIQAIQELGGSWPV